MQAFRTTSTSEEAISKGCSGKNPLLQQPISPLLQTRNNPLSLSSLLPMCVLYFFSHPIHSFTFFYKFFIYKTSKSSFHFLSPTGKHFTSALTPARSNLTHIVLIPHLFPPPSSSVPFVCPHCLSRNSLLA